MSAFKYIFIGSIILNMSCTNIKKQKEIQNTFPSDTLKIDLIEKKTELDSLSCGLIFKSKKSYKVEKAAVEKSRNNLSKKYFNALNIDDKNKLLDTVKVNFTKMLLNNIIPHWYGTVWDFNGYTAIPNKGTIACGYFVSTTLQDMGLNLNRYKLAQQGPENEAKSIAISLHEVLHFKENNITAQLKKLDDGVYFIGLDNHVGFLYIHNKNSYFLHSNYIDGKVMLEHTDYSEAFHSGDYYISNITANTKLMEKWLKKEEIRIFME